MSAIVGCGMKWGMRCGMRRCGKWRIKSSAYFTRLLYFYPFARIITITPASYSCRYGRKHSAMSLQPQISIHYTTIPSPLPSSPSFNFHLTCMANTLMIWVGTGLPTDAAGDAAGGAASMGSVEQVDNKLTADWSVAMPSKGVGLVSVLNCSVQKR